MYHQLDINEMHRRGSNDSALKTPASKQGIQEFKDDVFTIEPDGTHGKRIQALISNNNPDNL
jgi:hypothetical protein